MTRDDIIRLAREAGMNTVYTVIEKHEDGTQTVIDHLPFLARFAALVAAVERDNLITELKWLTRERDCGRAGIKWDVEP
jgi:hypothetical protein